jgi:hypothetical protein
MPRMLGAKTPIKNIGPKNAPGPVIGRPLINRNPQNPGVQPPHPVMYPKQLNPISSETGMPQYNQGENKGGVPAQHLMAILAALRGGS